jgi:hypothetical protein
MRRIWAINAFSGSGTSLYYTAALDAGDERQDPTSGFRLPNSLLHKFSSLDPIAESPKPKAQSPPPARNLSQVPSSYRVFSNRNLPLCVVDRGNPVCYR